MATFQLTGPDGANYSVTAPDEQSALKAFSSFNGGAQQPAQPAAPQLDKYQQAAQDDVARQTKTGTLPTPGMTERLVHGATMGADTPILSAADTPFQMIKHGTFNPAEGYRYARARTDAINDAARKNTGVAGDVAEAVGGAATGGELSRAGLTAARYLTPRSGLIAHTLASAADAAGLGGIAGFNEGHGLSDSLEKGAGGAIAGGTVGGAIPIVGSAVRGVTAPIFANLRARFNPEGFANSQVARAVHESGLTPAEVEQRVQQAAREGQPQFTTADALGNSGQELLGTAARGPGPARTNIVNTLNARQADQGRRVVNAINEGFDTPRTAAQTEASMTEARGNRADHEYGNVRNNAGRVDVVPALDSLDRNIGTQAGQAVTPANDSVEAVLTPFRERLSRVNPDDFDAVQRIRGDMADAAQNARQQGYGNRARLINQAVMRLDAAMETASPGFRRANQNFAQTSRNIEQIGEGRTAATRGRPEDNIADYQGLTPEGQYAYRAGMADQLAGKAENAAEGANKARPLTSDAFRQKAEVMAPNNDQLQRQLDRENTMFDTRATATGGSSTAKNLAHDEAAGMDPTLAMHVITGNVHGALGHIISAGKNTLTGNTPAVRQAVANMLLRNGTNLPPGQLAQAVDRTIARMRFMQNLGRAARAARGGGQIAATQEATAPTPPDRLYVSPGR